MLAATAENPGALRWLFVVQLLSMGAMEMSGPFWPVYFRTLGNLSPSQLAWASGIAYAGPMVMALCFTSFWGRLGDRMGHKPMVLRALIALALTQLWIASTEDVLSILAARLVQGALAGFIAAAQAYGTGLVERSKRGSLMAKLQLATAIGSVAGPVAGGAIFDLAGFSILNFTAAGICLACALVAWLVLPPVAVTAPRERKPGQAINPFTYSALYGLLLGIVLVQTGKMMPQAFFGLYAEQVLQVPAWMTGLFYGAAALGLCLAAPVWGKRFDSHPRPIVLSQVEWVCWACAGIVAVQAASQSIVVFVLARLAWGICLGALLPVFYALLSRDTGAEEQGRVLGAGNSAAKAGALIGTGAGALTLAFVPLAHAFWPVVAVYVLAAVGLRAIRKREKSLMHIAPV